MESDAHASSDRPVAWGTLALCLIGPALGVALAIAMLVGVILPTLGYGVADRIIAVGERLDSPLDGAIVFLGSSVVEEGIDARSVAAEAPGWTALNFAISGCEINEQRVMLPKVLDAGPRAVSLLVRPITLATPGDIPIDKAYGYNLAGFAQGWPPGDAEDARPIMSDDTLDVLRAPTWRATLHHRRMPILAMNEVVRRRLRGGLRHRQPDDFDAPYNMTFSISGRILDNHVSMILEENERRLADLPLPVGIELTRAVQQIAAAGAMPVIVIAPQHPRIVDAIDAQTDQLSTIAQDLCAAHDGLFIDARDLVDADGFADALHLAESGRDRLSRYIGARLGEP